MTREVILVLPKQMQHLSIHNNLALTRLVLGINKLHISAMTKKELICDPFFGYKPAAIRGFHSKYFRPTFAKPSTPDASVKKRGKIRLVDGKQN